MPCRQITPVFPLRLFQRRACLSLRLYFYLRRSVHERLLLSVDLVFRNSLRIVLVLLVQFKHLSCLFSIYGSCCFFQIAPFRLRYLFLYTHWLFVAGALLLHSNIIVRCYAICPAAIAHELLRKFGFCLVYFIRGKDVIMAFRTLP